MRAALHFACDPKFQTGDLNFQIAGEKTGALLAAFVPSWRSPFAGRHRQHFWAAIPEDWWPVLRVMFYQEQ